MGFGTSFLIGTGTALGTGIAGLGGAAVSGEYQKDLQEDQQKFLKEQSKNQIKYNVQQMKELGYSPSLLFSGNTPSGGGAGGGGMGKAPDFAGPILQAINTVGNLWMKDKELDNKEKNIQNNERYIDLLEKKAANQNAANYSNQRNKNEYNFNNVYDDFTNLNDI